MGDSLACEMFKFSPLAQAYYADLWYELWYSKDTEKTIGQMKQELEAKYGFAAREEVEFFFAKMRANVKEEDYIKIQRQGVSE